MKKTVFSASLAAFLMVSTTISCFAGDGWQANITISSGNTSSRLTFGQNQAATDLNDGLYDVPALMSGSLRTAFTCNGEMLWRDIKALEAETNKEWRLSISSDTGKDIIIQWDKGILPKNVRVALVDVDIGKSIDMKVLPSYSMGNRNGGELLIKVSNI